MITSRCPTTPAGGDETFVSNVEDPTILKGSTRAGRQGEDGMDERVDGLPALPTLYLDQSAAGR